ncbi:MAG: response regulator [Elusimicrobiota bacterium]
MKILVVDDDMEIQEMLEVFLQSLNFESVKAFNASEGLKQILTDEPDVVLLDIRLPDRDGVEMLKEIKQVNKNISVIMITGYKEAERVIEAFRHGAFDCLLKPFNFEYMKNLLFQLKAKIE